MGKCWTKQAARSLRGHPQAPAGVSRELGGWDPVQGHQVECIIDTWVQEEAIPSLAEQQAGF
jgi:hypothetical protein